MLIDCFGYLCVTATDVAAWRDYAQRVLAMEIVPLADGALALRMDDRWGRIFVAPGATSGPSGFGFQVADAAALAEVIRRLSGAGHPIRRATPAEQAQRRTEGLAIGIDPAGNRLEFYHGLARAETPYRPARPMSGFRTGELGLGHAVLNVTNYDLVLPLYRDLLGFQLTDYTLTPFRGQFLHTNTRHHSLALFESDRNGMHHLMVEVLSLDDVGKAYDAALEKADRVAVTLGRHANDHITSFYSWNPSGFMVEYGWGGRSVSEGWVPSENSYGPSFWGHERCWLPEEKRVEARRLRALVARDGLSAPVHVAPGSFDLIGSE